MGGRKRTIERGNRHHRYRYRVERIEKCVEGLEPFLGPFLHMMLRDDEEKEEKFCMVIDIFVLSRI